MSNLKVWSVGDAASACGSCAGTESGTFLGGSAHTRGSSLPLPLLPQGEYRDIFPLVANISPVVSISPCYSPCCCCQMKILSALHHRIRTRQPDEAMSETEMEAAASSADEAAQHQEGTPDSPSPQGSPRVAGFPRLKVEAEAPADLAIHFAGDVHIFAGISPAKVRFWLCCGTHLAGDPD